MPNASFLRRRREMHRKGMKIMKQSIEKHPKIVAMLFFCMLASIFSYSANYEKYATAVDIGAGRALSNANATTFDGDAEGVHSCSNYVALKQVGPGFAILWIIVLLYFFVGLAIICDDFFVSSLERISESLNLSEDVAGATFMAAGSSAPELFTSVMDTFYFTNNIGIGTIVGSAVFNILVIIALAAAMSSKDLLIDWRPFLRDCCFYAMSVLLLFIFVISGSFTWWHSLLLVLFYMLYVLFMVFNERLLAKCGDPNVNEEDVEELKDSIATSAHVQLSSEIDTDEESTGTPEKDNRKMIIPHMMSVTEGGSTKEEGGEEKSLYDKVVDVICVPWSFIFSITIPDAGETSKYKKYYVVTFIMSLLWITALSYILCDMVARLGCMWGIPASIMGLTVLAAGTSVPDALGSIVAAREGMGDMAVSNAIGSNVFDVCLGLGIPYLIKTGIVEGGKEVIAISPENVQKILPSILILAITLFGTGAIMVLNKWRLTQNVGKSLFGLYLCFFIYNVILGFIG